VRFLLVNNHCISDPTGGVTHSLRTIMSWLADAGHDCRVLTTARFESDVVFTIEEHLSGLGVEVSSRVVEYDAGGVPATLLLTRANDEAKPDPEETRWYLEWFEKEIQGFAPDQVIASNAHPMVQAAMARAHDRGITTAFAVRGYGYYSRHYFEHVHHAFTCSQFLTDVYRTKVGLHTTPLEPPIDWSTVIASDDARRFVTFVHPAPHKGLLVFARLATMLGSRRPDIPLLVVQSGRSAGQLNAIPGVDFSRYPQIVACAPVPCPADFLALTRILLVPSVWDEPFGRVAAEAIINGIPPLVSARGALPGVVGGDVSQGGGGYVLPLPDWLTVEERRLPEERELEPWFDAVCALWDDPALYARVSARARDIAGTRYGEAPSRRRHVDYFTSLKPTARSLGERMAV
jgi:glycosyltransferase involved in cell wall biosynthesis